MPKPSKSFLLYADIVGYTKILQQDEALALEQLDQFHEILKSQVETNGGQLLQVQRDSGLAGFEQAVDAVNCATALQASFQEAAPAIPVRIGIHKGEVVVKQQQAFGKGVLETTQLERIGIANSIVLSKAVIDQLPEANQLATKSLGAFQFKNVDQAIEVFALAQAGLNIPKQKEEGQQAEKEDRRKRWVRALQLFAGYLVAAWTIIQFVDWLLNRYQISPYWTDILLWSCIGIIPSLLLYLVNQKRMHQEKMLRREQVLMALNGILLFGGLTIAYGGSDLGSKTTKLTFIDLNGARVEQRMVKPEFNIQTKVYPFEQETGPDSTQWMAKGIAWCIGYDLIQDQYLKTFIEGDAEEMEKIQIAKSTGIDYFIDGTYQFKPAGFAVTVHLKEGKTGKILNTHTVQGKNLFVLGDSLSILLRKSMGISPYRIEHTIDLDLNDFFTDNMQALKYFSIGGRVNWERALEADSTFVYALYQLALSHYGGGHEQMEAKINIKKAVQYRKGQPQWLQNRLLISYYQIFGEWEKAEKHINLLLEANPYDDSTLNEAYWLFMTTGQPEKAITYQEQLYDIFPTPNLKFFILYMKARVGNIKKVEKEIEAILKKDPEHLAFLQILTETYIHNNKMEEARATVERMMIIAPEQEVTLKPLLEAIDYMESNPDFESTLTKFTGFYRPQYNERIDIYEVSNRGIVGRTEGTDGWYIFPISENQIVHGGLYRSYLTECLTNEDGEVYAAKVSDRNSNEDKELGVTFSYVWKQDSLIWKAEDLLRDHFYEKADSAYDQAIAKHPEHFYLYEAKKHLAYRASKSEEEIKTLYQRYIGQYGEARVWEEDGQLYYKRPGLARRILLPISDQEYITLYSYGFKYKFDVQDGIVKGMNLYNYDNENETWKLNENWYDERTVLKN